MTIALSASASQVYRFRQFYNDMPSSADKFCPQCAKINFNFVKRFQKDRVNAKLPQISWSKLYPEDCQFCQLLLHCTRNNQDVHDSWQSTLRGVYDGCELQLYAEDGTISRKLDYSIIHCESMPSSCLIEEPQDSKCFNVNELRLWLAQCEHHACGPNGHSPKPLPEDFRLVDVWNNCVVSPKIPVDYCALSYVWGDALQLCLTSANRFESQDSLDMDKLPKTLRDAIALCQELGCQYIWVDSICIIQDSEVDKVQQIRSMANIYSGSFLTIIAAVGDDANAGLAPFQTRSSKLSYLVRRSSKGSFVATLSPQIAAQEIPKSKWAKRGWTVQEYALSRRVLFFTGPYTFLRCEGGLRCEDFGLGFSDCSAKDFKWDLPLPPFYRNTPDPDRHYESTFSQILAQYVHRSLRYDSDILAAFTGILTRMERSIGTDIWGLPSKEFGVALQWKTGLPFPSSQRAGFPSWTWAGWIHGDNFLPPNGDFHDMYEGYDDCANNISVLTCYKVENDKCIHSVEENDPERIIMKLEKTIDRYRCSNNITDVAGLGELRQHFTLQNYQELQDYIDLQSPCKPPISHHVFLSASCISLYIDRFPGLPASLDSLIRINESSPPIGSICLEPKWRNKEPDLMDFFVSTAGIATSPDDDPHPLQLEFKVVLIKLIHNTRPPVYKRIQVSNGGISHRNWILANPKSRLIALV